MKAIKALRRLTKIEALMSDVVERYSGTAPAVREALQDAMAAVTVAKEAVNLEATTGTEISAPVEHSGLQNAEAAESVPAKKAAAKKSVVKSSKKAAPVEKTGRQQERSRTPTR